jgi:hypothetical protein
MPMTLQDRIEKKLDYALEMTFPASDPFTICVPQVEIDDEAAAGADSGAEAEPPSAFESTQGGHGDVR